jgi:hypothetical protein
LTASLDELEATTGYLNGAVAGSQMTITHMGILHLAPGIVLSAVVCPEAAANLIGMMPLLNASPDLSLTIGAAAAGAHVCCVTPGPIKLYFAPPKVAACCHCSYQCRTPGYGT